MADTSPYKDKRSDFFREYFEQALPFDEYIQTGTPEQTNRWQSSYELASLNTEQAELTAGFSRQMNILFMSGIWCGDCSRQAPQLQRIAEASDKINLKFIDNKQFPELTEELRINGATKVPVAVFLSEDFFELGRFGDKFLGAYRRKAEKELGAMCDAGILPPPKEEVEEELSDWLGEVERLQHMLRLAPMLRRRYED